MEVSGELQASSALLTTTERFSTWAGKLRGAYSQSAYMAKNLCPCQESNPSRPTSSLLIALTELYWVQNSAQLIDPNGKETESKKTIWVGNDDVAWKGEMHTF
jgi:hypothetical protein